MNGCEAVDNDHEVVNGCEAKSALKPEINQCKGTGNVSAHYWLALSWLLLSRL